MRYVIVAGPLDEIGDSVQDALHKGWQLHGSASPLVIPPGCVSAAGNDFPKALLENDGEKPELWIYQPMTHDDDGALHPQGLDE